MTNRDLLTRRWRAIRPPDGRLQWNTTPPRLHWELGEVVRVVRKRSIYHFHTLAGFIDRLEQAESFGRWDIQG